MKKTLWILILLLCLCGCSHVSYDSVFEGANSSNTEDTVKTINTADSPNSANTAFDNAGLIVHFLDVGQGDCELIESNGEFMLIDCGENEYSRQVTDYIKSKGAKKLKYIIATHPHSDHIGGMSSIIDTFDVENIIMPDKTSNSTVFEKMLTSIENKGLEITIPSIGDTFTLGSSSFTIIAPVRDYSDLNNASVGIKLSYGETSFVMCGDAEKEAELDICQSDISCDVLKINHHGSSTSSCSSFLDAASPRFAIISCGKDNSYGHPHKETIDSLESKGITYMRTDELGTITAECDGKNISWRYDENVISYYHEDNTHTEKSESTTQAITEGNTTITEVNANTAAYILNTNTKKFHKPDCSGAANTAEKNKQSFNGTREELIAAGYKPCQRCNP